MIIFDHFIYGVPDLKEAVVDFQKKAGIAPAFGGRHPSLGTQNALVSLGNSYFELLSADPSCLRSTQVGVESLKDLKAPRLIAWALQCTDFKEAEPSLKAYQMGISQINRGSRQTPDGTLLNYEFASITGATGPDGAIPFLIKWINSVHPSVTSPHGCQFDSFELSEKVSPNFKKWIQSTLAKLNFTTESAPIMALKIQTPLGIIQVTSGQP